MYPNQASYKVIHPGLIGATEEVVLFPSGKLESPDLKWDNFFMPTPMRFIQRPGDSPPLYVSKSSFSQSDSSWFDWSDEEAASHKVIHPGLIGATKKLCYSQTAEAGITDLKVG
ncbi:hypothetical protein Bca101_102103 [Brassica carinata]